MNKKIYEQPTIEFCSVITTDFLTESDEPIILPPHEFNVY